VKHVITWPNATALALACAACAFNFGGPPVPEGSCSADDECNRHEVCNPTTSRCEMQMPEAEEDRLVGPFAAAVDEPLWGGPAVVGKWDEYTSNGYKIPAMEVHLTHMTALGLGNDQVMFLLKSPRGYDAVVGMMAFYMLLFSAEKSEVENGNKLKLDGSSLAGQLLLCPADIIPEDGSLDPYNPWMSTSNEALNRCYNLHAIYSGSVGFEEASLDEGGTVRGYLDLELEPFVIAPGQW
jgi:hypothetical protein